MKKNIPLIFLFLIFISSAKAQEKRINLYGGYVFDDKFDSYYDPYNYFYGKIKGGFQYGAGFEFLAHPDFGLELIYFGQNTTAPTTNNGSNIPEVTRDFNLNFNYAMLAANRYIVKEGSNHEIYFGVMAGALFANVSFPDSSYNADAVKFSWALRVGVNFWLSDRVGIKIQSQLLSTIQAAGGVLYFGSGNSFNGSTTTSSMLQFGFSSGLVFKFGNKNS